MANRTQFGDRLTVVALAADGDSANDPNLIAIKACASYLTGTIGVYPAVCLTRSAAASTAIPGRRPTRPATS
ncbi:MAG TPA: hypothetical protein VEF89_00730 [Solirubrobacteraceae bacterium]|nr:hypothetical protein [Solirubrobacteraceae bacterium]